MLKLATHNNEDGSIQADMTTAPGLSRVVLVGDTFFAVEDGEDVSEITEAP